MTMMIKINNNELGRKYDGNRDAFSEIYQNIRTCIITLKKESRSSPVADNSKNQYEYTKFPGVSLTNVTPSSALHFAISFPHTPQ